MKRILITYATYGNGHKRIAEYMDNYLDKTEYEIKMINILDYTGFVINTSVKILNFMCDHRMEGVFSFLYNSLNSKMNINVYNVILKKFVYNKKLKKEFVEFNPDLVLSSHFFGSNIANYLNKTGDIKTKIMTIITDYTAHKFWLANKDPKEIFIVANDIVKNGILKHNNIPNRIYPYGIPFDILKFNNIQSKDKILSKYKISPNKKVILFFAGGGNGFKGYIKYYKKMIKMNLKDTEIIMVCGKNEEIFEEAKNIKEKYNATNVHVYGFINNVYELLKISDLVITKPGGATVTECIETENVMLLLPGVGGQETMNAKFVCKNGYGLKTRYTFMFKRKLLKLLNNESEFNKYKDSYKNKDKNDSLAKISNLIEKELR